MAVLLVGISSDNRYYVNFVGNPKKRPGPTLNWDRAYGKKLMLSKSLTVAAASPVVAPTTAVARPAFVARAASVAAAAAAWCAESTACTATVWPIPEYGWRDR